MRHNSPMKNKNSLLSCLSLIAIFSISQPLLAVEPPATAPWYQIEVLVYEPTSQIIANERWPEKLTENKPRSLIQLAPIIETNTLKSQKQTATTTAESDTKPRAEAYQQLPPENLTLTETANRLIRSRNYRVITLQGWQQPVKQRHEADAVHFTNKPTASDVLVTQQGETLLNPRAINFENELLSSPHTEGVIGETNIDGEIIEEVPPRIDGSITVSLSRYLHMSFNIRYYNPDVYLAEQIALQKLDEAIIDTFELRQSRRMRSQEVHVFDHPYFGIIATIIPVEKALP